MNSLRARILMLVSGAGLLTAIVLAAVMHMSVRSYYTDVVYTQSLAFIDRVIEMHPDPKKALSDGSQNLQRFVRDLGTDPVSRDDADVVCFH